MQEANIESIYPLSPMQQGMLFHTLYSPDDGVYINQLHYRIEGKLYVDALHQAWQCLLDQHPVLRTLFAWEKRVQPLQLVRRGATLPWQQLDWQADSEARQQQRLTDYLKADRQTGFALDKAPLMRCCLIQLAANRWHFIWTHHHLILDGWSGGLVHEAVVAAYELLRQGHPAVSASPRPYGDYIKWLQQQNTGNDAAWWQQRLAGLSAPTPLPLDRKSGDEPGIPQALPASLQLALPAELYRQLQTQARRCRLTLNTFIQAAWALLLSRYSRESTVVFGETVSGRPTALSGFESMVGLFINTLPVRCDIDEDANLLDWLQTLFKQQSERSQHSHCALSDIQRWSEFPSHVNLFDSVVVFENHLSGTQQGNESNNSASVSGGELKIGDMQVHEKTNFPLTLVIEPGKDSTLQATLRLKFMYDAGRFEPANIERLLGHLQNLLTGMAQSLDRSLNQSLNQPIARLPLLSAAETQAILSCNRIRQTFKVTDTLTQRFSAAVQRHPEKIALRLPLAGAPDAAQKLSYAGLEIQSTGLAQQLLSQGVQVGERVGICLDRSLDMVVAILGVLKAGAAYVPLDPAMPEERLGFILKDADVRFVVTHTRVSGALVLANENTQLIELDAWLALKTPPGQSIPLPLPFPEITPEQTAYIIYTSGSTGQPKGVEVSHANVLRLFEATCAEFQFSQQDVWSLFHSFAFDFSVWELWGGLLYGGEVVIVPQAISRSPEDFFHLLRDCRVTMLSQTPSAFRQLIEVAVTLEHQANPLTDLRCVVFGGEALNPGSLQPWFAVYGDEQPQIINMYGITETTVHVTYHRVRQAEAFCDHSNGYSSIIGHPIADLHCLLLDERGRLVPFGVAGELLVGGGGVAKGYLNRTQLTKEKFVDIEQYAGIQGLQAKRFYRSGDLARLLPDGRLEYLGRADDQVKIRGFRIELGEIESALAGHPHVKAALALVREDGLGKQLMACLIPTDNSDADSKAALAHQAQWQTYLRARLPDYMIPAHFVVLESFPLTANGKVDKRALLALCQTGFTQNTTAYLAPRDGVEELLAGIWQTVLSVEKVGVNDNYFELGGDSIRSMGLLAKARKAGLPLTLQDIFDCPTVAQQALKAAQAVNQPVTESANQSTEQSTGEKIATEPFALIDGDDRAKLPPEVIDAYPLTRLQSGMWFHSLLSPQSALYHNLSSYHIQAPFASNLLQTAIQQVAQRHDVMRTAFDFNRYSQPLQLVYPSVTAPFKLFDLRAMSSEQQDQAVNRWFDAELTRHFAVTDFPLYRFTVHQRSERAFQLSLTEHHAIFDGWSVASLMTEVFQDYCRLLEEKPQSEAPGINPLRYRDFVALEREAIQSSACREYWKNTVSQCEATRVAWNGVASAEPPVQDSLGLYRVPIEPELSSQLKALARQLSVPVKSILLACHLRVLACLTHGSQVVTGLITNGRPEQAGGDSLLGLFLNTLPFSLTIEPDQALRWDEVIQRCFRQEWQMLPYRRFPLAEIQQLTPAGQELFNTTFNFTYFHVYQQALKNQAFSVVDGRFFEKTNYALSTEFGMDPQSNELNLVLDYDTGIFSAAAIAEIGGYYRRAMQSVAADVKSAYTHMDFLSTEQREQALFRHNDTAIAYPQTPFIRLFEAQAKRGADRIAAVFGDEGLSYAELNARANHLACELIAQGVGRASLVGLCIERSLPMLIGLLAIAKTGAAYVPLDPAFPAERLQLIVEDAQPSALLIADNNVLSRFIHCDDIPTLMVSDHQTSAANPAYAENPIVDIQPDDLAYVIYTSGSTGRPKGVEITHGALTNFLNSMTEQPGFSAEDALLAVTTISFDIAALELYLPLINGGKLVIASREETLQGAKLAELIRQFGITVMQATPSTWRLLLAANWPGQSGLKLLSGGEGLPLTLARQLLQRGASVWNLYGPTETTIWSSVHRLSADEEDKVDKVESAGVVPLGRPIANTQCYVLDQFQQPVPPGFIGELYIGGAGVAKGYRNQPELSAQRFMANPFIASVAPSANHRLYRTGDLVRRDQAGILHFVGRADQQIKLRGYRIELGEIESVIASVAGVTEAVAGVYRPGEEDSRLLAYVVPQAVPEQPDWAALEERILAAAKARLPSYMVPAAIVRLEAFPLTPNGKIDRRALAASYQPNAFPVDAAALIQPGNPVEQTLAGLWQALLSLEQVGVTQNFFDIGGNSLLLMRLHSQLEQTFQCSLSLVELFNRPNIKAQAGYINSLLAQPQNHDALCAQSNVAENQLDKLQQRAQRQKQAMGRRRGDRLVTPTG